MLTFLELELPLQCIRIPLANGAVCEQELSGSSTGDWERPILDALQARLPDGELLRWAITSVCDRRQVVTVEVVATCPGV